MRRRGIRFYGGDKVRRVRDGKIGYVVCFVGKTYKPQLIDFKWENGLVEIDRPSTDFVLIERNPWNKPPKRR